MKKEVIRKIIKNYLNIFPDEHSKLLPLLNYIKETTNDLMCDWNNVKGHLTAGAFIYSKKLEKFLVLLHRDLQMFLYPGGHCEPCHNTTLETAETEVEEEIGVNDFEIANISKNQIIPIDIDIHKIPFNSRVNMPEYYHFDFRYLFYIKDELNIIIDDNEISEFKWIDVKELEQDKNYGLFIKKLKKYLLI